MHRMTLAWTAVVLVITVLIGGRLVSEVLAATDPAGSTRTTQSVAAHLSDADVGPVFDLAADAAASALEVSTDDLLVQLADGRSLKEIADSRETGYGAIARAVNGAVSATLDAAVRQGSMGERRAAQVRAGVATWIDAGGQADSGWFGEPS